MSDPMPRGPALRWLLLGLLATGLGRVPGAWAHDARPAYLELNERGSHRYEVLWRTPVLSGMRLPVVLRFPPDVRTRGQPTEEELPDSVIERRLVEAQGGIAGKRIEFVGLEATITDVLVRVEQGDGAHSTILVRPSRPWVEITPSPGPSAVAGAYLRHGVEHILLGYDHLLFVLALILIVRSRRVLLATITAFTVAHSITLALAALGMAHVPSAPVEATIALSILLLACEILRLQRGEESLTARWPWVVAFSFGLLHGFGFASALVAIGLPPGDVPLALLAFNVGVEVGQLAFIAVVLGGAELTARLGIFSGVGPYVRPSAAYAIGTAAAFWFFQRLAGFVT